MPPLVYTVCDVLLLGYIKCVEKMLTVLLGLLYVIVCIFIIPLIVATLMMTSTNTVGTSSVTPVTVDVYI